MSTSKKRKLRAILFADIVGYTSLMQRDEANASMLLQKFRDSLKDKVSQHSGEVINNYGDGCLCTFESAVDAMTCANEIQLHFQKAPKVPVRIGLHSGDVYFEDDNVYGDSVNIASRIESLGVAGSILFSKRIKRHISNQSEFKLKSLGEFDFKNVDKTMEVFALANEGFIIPSPEEMKGKLKLSSTKTSKKTFLIFGGLLLLLAAYFAWSYFATPNNNLLSEEILSSRIAVLPFENKTSNEDLDMLGDMAADWITQGLTNFEDIKVVSFQNIKNNLKYADEGNLASFAKATGAEKIIHGNFYQEGEQLIFQSRVEDANSGIVEIALPPISGDKNQVSTIVKDLQQRVLGYFATSSDPWHDWFKNYPPNYEAYKILDKADDYFLKDKKHYIDLCNKAIEIDSNFSAAYLAILVTYGNMGQYQKLDSIVREIENRKLRFNKLQQLHYNYTTEFDPTKKSVFAKKTFEVDPKNVIYNYMAANDAIIRNDPEESVRISQHVEPSADLVKIETHGLWFHVYSIALTRLNRLDESMDILNLLSGELEDFYYKTMIYAIRGQEDSIQQMAIKLENRNTSNDISWFYNRAAMIYGILEDKPKQKEWASKALQYLNSQPESTTTNHFDLARANYLTEQYDAALSNYFELSQQGEYGNMYDDQGLWNYLSRMGSIYAKKGNREKAMEMIEQLKAVPDPRPLGRYNYGIGRIYAQLGDKEKAMNYLQQSFREGFNTADGYRFHDDIDLQPLYDYPPFEKLIKYRRKKIE